MFQSLLNQWLNESTKRMYFDAAGSHRKVLEEFAAWLDTRGLTLHEAESGTGHNTVSEHSTSDDVPFLLEWRCSCGEVYPITFVQCKCGQERPPLPDEIADV